MKHLFTFISFLLAVQLPFAQNVGIGTTTPFFKLDVRNGTINTDSAYRMRGMVFVYGKGGGGTESTLLGFAAGPNISTGHSNVAVGSAALFSNTSGSYNTATGNEALYWNKTGSFNTATGYYALNRPEGSQYNTAVGYMACANYLNGWNNTVVGAEADVSFPDQYNSIAIGNMAIATDNSKVRIGNSSNWSYEAFANWTNISDGRFKKNIAETIVGLNFIMRLRPVSYQVNVTALNEKFNENRGRENDPYIKAAITEKEKIIWTGFVAQEVEAAAMETHFQFSGVDKPRNEHGVYGLRYAEFVVPLVKAVQEQQVIIEKQNDIIEALKRDAETTNARLKKLETLLLVKE